MQLRTAILKQVLKIKPYDALEEEHVEFVRNWIASGAELCRIEKPATPAIHLVSYFILYDPVTQKKLLVDHKKAGLWLPSGGHVEVNEHPKVTVERELREELGIEAQFFFDDPLFLTVTQTVGLTAGHTDVSLWYVLESSCDHILQYDQDEFYGICWFADDELPFDRTDPHMKRFVNKFLSSIQSKCQYVE